MPFAVGFALAARIEANECLIKIALPFTLNSAGLADQTYLVMEDVINEIVVALSDTLVVISCQSVDVDQICVIVLGETLSPISENHQLNSKRDTFWSPSMAYAKLHMG